MSKRGKEMWFLCCILLITAFPVRLFSQVAHNLEGNLGFHSTNIRDISMSPLLYSGAGFSGGVSYLRSSVTKYKKFQLNYHQGNLMNNADNLVAYNGITSRNHTYYHKDNSLGNFFMYGWSNNNVLALYNEIAYGNYGNRTYYFTSFGPATSLYYKFSLFNKDAVIRLNTDVQLIGFYLRPSYISSVFEGFLDQENSNVEAFLRSIDVFFPGRSINFGYSPGILYAIGSSVDLSIDYNYEFTRINYPEPVSSSIGNWYFRIAVKI